MAAAGGNHYHHHPGGKVDETVPLTRSMDKDDQQQASGTGTHGQEHQFGFLVAMGMTVDYCLGAGFLGIPYAFYKSGLILGLFFVVLTSLMCNVTKDLIVEVMFKKAEKLKSRTDGTNDRANSEIEAVEFQEDPQIGRITSLRGSSGNESEGESNTTAPFLDIISGQWHKFEMPDLCAFFAGNMSRRIYVLTFSLYMYGALWSYAAVFSTSVSANIPLWNGICNPEGEHMSAHVHSGHKGGCETNLIFWLAVYALIAVPLACMELKDQVILQFGMFLARIVVIFLLCGTVYAAMGCKQVAFNNIPSGRVTSSFPLADSGGLSLIIPVTLYAQIYHHSIPVLAEPVRKKSSLKAIFLAAFALMGSFYVFLGVTIPLYFGSDTLRQCNLNWSDYVGCKSAPDDVSKPPYKLDKSIWAQIASIIVLIFPALDVLSAYPLNAITLGNNLITVFRGETTEPVTTRFDYWKIFYRLCAAAPPIILAGIIHDLDRILQFTGVIGVAIVLLIPVLLHMQSTIFCVQLAKWIIKQRGSSVDVYETSPTSTMQLFWNSMIGMITHPTGVDSAGIYSDNPYIASKHLVQELALLKQETETPYEDSIKTNGNPQDDLQSGIKSRSYHKTKTKKPKEEQVLLMNADNSGVYEMERMQSKTTIRSGILPPNVDEMEVLEAMLDSPWTRYFSSFSFCVPLLLVIAFLTMVYIFVLAILQAAGQA